MNTNIIRKHYTTTTAITAAANLVWKFVYRIAKHF